MGIIASKENKIEKAKNKFISAALQNNIKLAEKIISKYSTEKHEIMNIKGSLSVAICNGHKEFVIFLCKQGVDLNLITIDGHTALQIAIVYGSEDIVKLLLELGADVNLVDISPIIFSDKFEIIKLLILSGYRVSDENLIEALRARKNELAILMRLACNNSCYNSQLIYEWINKNKENPMSQLMRLPVVQFVKHEKVILVAERYPEIMKLPTNVYGTSSGKYEEEKFEYYSGTTAKLLKKVFNSVAERKAKRNKNPYYIPKISNLDKTLYRFMPVGNDPVINIPEIYRHSDKKIALIASSGLRSVEIACQLGNKNYVPKIFIIDNSVVVYKFWSKFKEFMWDESETATQELFEQNFMPDDQVSDLPLTIEINGVIYPNQNIKLWLLNLFDRFSYDYVKKVICHTSLLLQKWEDPIVFERIKNILAFHEIDKVFLYPTNIIDFIGDHSASHPSLTVEQYAILKNISTMNPELTILTDLCWKNEPPVWDGCGYLFGGWSTHPENVHFVGRGESLPVTTGMTWWLTKNNRLWKNPLSSDVIETPVVRKRSFSI